jgi:hypothetical protein
VNKNNNFLILKHYVAEHHKGEMLLNILRVPMQDIKKIIFNPAKKAFI